MIYDAPDWCHHSGIPRPVVLPEDDEVTDLSAWLAGRFDDLATNITTHGQTA